jgi:hypothetical protein
MAKEKNINEEFEQEKKENLKNNIENLRGNINGMLEQIDMSDDFFPEDDMLPGLDLKELAHDYERDIETIKIDAKETINCLANLYLDEEKMKNKNINTIIKDDADKVADLNFSISCSKRALIQCMRQVDMGSNNPELFNSVTNFQKELRDTIKVAYELIHVKMKEFYKILKEEQDEINAGPTNNEDENLTTFGDPKKLNELFEQIKDDPTLLKKLSEGQENIDDIPNKTDNNNSD